MAEERPFVRPALMSLASAPVTFPESLTGVAADTAGPAAARGPATAMTTLIPLVSTPDATTVSGQAVPDQAASRRAASGRAVSRREASGPAASGGGGRSRSWAVAAAAGGVLVVLVVLALVVPHGGRHAPTTAGPSGGDVPATTAGGGTAGGSPVPGVAPPSAGHASGGVEPSGTPGKQTPTPAVPSAGAPPTTPARVPPVPTVNLALHKATGESSHTQQYAGANATDGDSGTYWESTDGAFPQWLQVDLGAVATPQQIVVRLPPLSTWQARTQSLSVQGSVDGATFTTLVGSATYRFDPASANTASVRLSGTPARFVRLVFTDNSIQHGGQISELQVY